MAPPTRVDPFSVLHFRLEIDGLKATAFSECTGLSSNVEVIEYREGGDVGSARILPGVRKFSNLRLKCGITKDRELWDWYKTALDGAVKRRNGSVVLMDEAGNDVVRWNFRQGWPCKIEGPALNASSSEVAIESQERELPEESQLSERDAVGPTDRPVELDDDIRRRAIADVGERDKEKPIVEDEVEDHVRAIHRKPRLLPQRGRGHSGLRPRGSGYGERVASIRIASARQVFPPSDEASAFQRKESFVMS